MAYPDLSRIIYGMAEPALLVGRDGRIVAGNPPASRLFRLSSEQIIGKPLRTLVSDDPEKLTRYLRRCSRGSKGTPGRLSILRFRGRAISCNAVGRLMPGNHKQSRLLCLTLLPREAAKAPFTESDALLHVSGEKQARQQADKRWRTAFESAAIGIVMADFNGRYFAANRAFRSMLGYTERELYRLTFEEITFEEDRESNVLLVRELAEGKRKHFEIEKRYYRKDGTLLWTRQHVAVVPGIQGIAPFWFGVVEDITGRKRIEGELRLEQQNFRESEARFQAFIDNSPNLIFMKDREGRYFYLNKECKRALGITQEVKGKRDDELFSPEQASAFQANDRQVIEAGVPMEFEEVAVQQDGPHTSIVHKFPLFNADGEIYAIGGIVTDITERKKEESARRLSDERYRVVVETANDAVLSTDETGAILFANSATSKIFGYDPTELIGKPLTMLMPEFIRKVYESGFRRYMDTGVRHMNWKGAELVGLHKNGKEFPVEISLGELTQGGRRTFTGFIRDISERKQAEEMRSTAVQFLTKPFSDQDLLEAIRIALERHRNRHEQGQELAKLRPRFESLTPRERQVTSMVVSGMPNKQISRQLGTSENTVKVHRSRAMEKMQARSLPELVRMMEQLKDIFEKAS
jgi:PAS domain S-box-containing protein